MGGSAALRFAHLGTLTLCFVPQVDLSMDPHVSRDDFPRDLRRGFSRQIARSIRAAAQATRARAAHAATNTAAADTAAAGRALKAPCTGPAVVIHRGRESLDVAHAAKAAEATEAAFLERAAPPTPQATPGMPGIRTGVSVKEKEKPASAAAAAGAAAVVRAGEYREARRKSGPALPYGEHPACEAPPVEGRGSAWGRPPITGRPSITGWPPVLVVEHDYEEHLLTGWLKQRGELEDLIGLEVAAHCAVAGRWASGAPPAS